MSRLPAHAARLALALSLALPSSVALAQMSPEMKSQVRELMKPCRPDFQRYCSNVQRGGGRVLACLQSHEKELSPACSQAMAKLSTMRNSTGQ